jgi:hypothetical protein
MEAHNAWYEKINGEITLHQQNLSKKEVKKYKLDFLLRVAKRVAEFCPECGHCQLFQQEITTLVQDLSNLIQLPDKQKRRNYHKKINHIVKHLQSEHKLVVQGQNVGLWISIGTAIGVAIGAGMDSIGGGIPIGIGIGTAIGIALDAKAKKEGRVI